MQLIKFILDPLQKVPIKKQADAKAKVMLEDAFPQAQQRKRKATPAPHGKAVAPANPVSPLYHTSPIVFLNLHCSVFS